MWKVGGYESLILMVGTTYPTKTYKGIVCTQHGYKTKESSKLKDD